MTKQASVHKHHLEALIDGVFAIAMTILVLEVKVPDLANPSSASELMHSLQHHLYVIVAYFISFAMLGLFWMWHHRLSNKIREINAPLTLCSLAFLSLVCFFPFAAALFGRYIAYGNVFVLHCNAILQARPGREAKPRRECGFFVEKQRYLRHC